MSEARDKKPGGLLSSALRLAKQATSGAIQTYGLGSIDDATYKANIARIKAGQKPELNTQIPILEPSITGLYKLSQIVSDALPISHRVYNPTLEASAEKMARSRKAIQEKLNIGEPQNALEVGAEISSNFLIPGHGQKKVAEKVAEGLVPKLVKGAGKTAVELAVPLRQGGAKTVAATTGLVAGLGEAADALDNKDDYHGIADLMRPEAAVLQPEKQKAWSDYLDEDVVEEYNHAVDTGDVETQNMITEAAYNLQQQDTIESYTPPAPDWETEKRELAALAIAAAGVFVGRGVLNRTKQKLMSTSVLSGQAAPTGLSSAGTKLSQGFIQNDQAVRDATKEMTGQKGKVFGVTPEQQLWEAKFDAVSAPSLNSKFNHFSTTGEIKDAATTTDPVGPLLSSIARDLAPDERALLTDGLLAGTSLDDYYRTGKQSSFLKDRQGNPMTVQQLEQLRDTVANSPRLSPYASAVKDQYRKQLDLLKEKGFLSQDQYDEWVQRRPNFVHMSKNEADDVLGTITTRGDPTRIPADTRKGTMWARSDDEGGGVRVGEAADPIIELTNQWAKVIKQTAIQDVKKPWLEMASSHPELGKHVKRIPMGQTPNADKASVHTVWENGMPVHYVIDDAQLAQALDFTPFVNQSAASVMLSMPKRLFEFGTTGPAAPLFAPTSAMYDTIAGIVNRPKGYDLGLINEFMNKVSKGKVNIGGFDPTMWVSAPVGAVRLAWDSTVQAMSNELATQLTKGSGLVFDNLGPAETQALQTRLAGMYSASIKGMMDEYGAANSNIFSAGTVSRLAPGLAHVAPEFATDAALQAMRDAIKGDHTFAQKVLATSHVPLEAIRANSISRIYTGLLKSIHEGFRYQAFATNLPKVIGDEDAAKIMASQTRRLSADIGQTGAGQLAHMITQNGAYVNVGIQSLAQFARMMKADPVTFTANLSNVMLTTGALFLGYAAASPENRAKIRAMSDEELSRVIPTFGGLPIVMEPTLRPLVGPYIATLKDVSGMSEVNPDGTDNFDPNLGKIIGRMLENDLSEGGKFSAENAFQDNLGNVSPVNLASFPMVNALAAGLTNMDLSFTRYTSRDNLQPQPIKSQEVDPLAGDGRFVGDAISARWAKTLENVAGAHLFGYARAAMDAQRAAEAGASDEKALEVAFSRITDNWAKQSGPANMMFQQYEKARSPNVTEFKLFYAKKEGFEQAIKVMNDLILTPMSNGKDPATAMLSQLDPLDIERNMALQGTALLPIGSVAAEIQQQIRGADLDSRVNQLKKQIDDVNNQRTSTIEERNKLVNDLNKERMQYIEIMNNMYQVGEEVIRDRIGDPTFTWQEFAKNPKQYERPLPQAVPEPVP